MRSGCDPGPQEGDFLPALLKAGDDVSNKATLKRKAQHGGLHSNASFLGLVLWFFESEKWECLNKAEG